ncbi:MAG: TMEM175 family protein [Ferruginibacter sp.]
MKETSKKEIAFERVLFFSDAIVAIAITLLALDLKLDFPESHQLSFMDLLSPWEKYMAFILSFINIAGAWRTHHDFFVYIKKMDERMMAYNILWLFFVVTLPFATSTLSTHFGQRPAIFLYSLNIFALSVFQNCLWDYADNQPDFIMREKLDERHQYDFRLMLNLDMINGLVAIIASFFWPKLAFFLLFFKLPLFVIVTFYIAGKRRKDIKVTRKNKQSGN